MLHFRTGSSRVAGAAVPGVIWERARLRTDRLWVLVDEDGGTVRAYVFRKGR